MDLKGDPAASLEVLDTEASFIVNTLEWRDRRASLLLKLARFEDSAAAFRDLLQVWRHTPLAVLSPFAWVAAGDVCVPVRDCAGFCVCRFVCVLCVVLCCVVLCCVVLCCVVLCCVVCL